MSAGEIAALCAAILGVAAVLGLLWKAVKGCYRAARRIERIEVLATELEHNSGSSMKDAVHRMDSRLVEVAQKVNDHDAALLVKKQEHLAMWEAIRVIAESTPARA